MNKGLLGTSAILLVSGLTFFTAESKADVKLSPPALKISGAATGTFHWFRNSPRARGEKGYGTAFALEDSRLNFQTTGRMDIWEATFYDWLIGITGDTAETKNVDENRLRLKSRFGTVLFGVHRGVEDFMARGAFSVLGGTGGGVGGNYTMTTTRPVDVYLDTDMIGATKSATKLSLVTPRFYGFQAGLSFTPNTEHKGEGKNGEPRNASSSKSPQEPFDIGSKAIGLNYLHECESGFKMTLSGTAVFGKTKTPAGGGTNLTNIYTAFRTAPRHDTASYAIGAVAEYMGFELGGEWINNGKSRQIKNPEAVFRAAGYNGPVGKFKNSDAWSIATGYTFGANKVAYGFYRSKGKANGGPVRANVHSVTYDRAIVPGFSLYAEGVAFNLKTNPDIVALSRNIAANSGGSLTIPAEKTVNNDGRTLLMGAKFKF